MKRIDCRSDRHDVKVSTKIGVCIAQDLYYLFCGNSDYSLFLQAIGICQTWMRQTAVLVVF